MSVASVDSDHIKKPLVSFESLYNAYQACRKRKRNTFNTLRFEHDLLENLRSLEDELKSGSYRPTRSVCFVTLQPKLREIFAADFRDRVVHHLLVPRLEQIFEPKFIHDSYACRKEKGTHAAAYRLRQFMQSVSRGGQKTAWFLQLDVRSFFMSIDKAVLSGIIERHVKDEEVFTLARTIIHHDCTESYIFRGDRKLHDQVPKHKTLFQTPEGKGLPIGNLTSQFFANVYLNELDQYVKHTLKARHYVRYVDDFILLHESRDGLLEWKDRISEFLHDRLALTLKPEYTLKRVSEGADFLGYIIRSDYLLVRNRVVGNLKAKLARYEKRIAQYCRTKGEQAFYRFDADAVAELRRTLASYLGHFKHANAGSLVKGLFERFAYLNAVFQLEVCGGHCKLTPLTHPSDAPSCFRQQRLWFEQRYQDVCLFFRVGRFYEIYGDGAREYGPILGLTVQTGSRGTGYQCGFPAGHIARYKQICRPRGVSYAVIEENGYYASGLKQRFMIELVRYT